MDLTNVKMCSRNSEKKTPFKEGNFHNLTKGLHIDSPTTNTLVREVQLTHW